MLEIELGDVPLSPQMKVFANELEEKKEFIEAYETLYDKENNPHFSTRQGRTKALYLSNLITTLYQNQFRPYLALSEITSPLISKKSSSKSQCSKILSEFMRAGLFLESRVYAVDVDRKFTMISFPDKLSTLQNAIDTYIEFINNPDEKNASDSKSYYIRSKANSIKDNISLYPSSQVVTREKNVIVVNDNEGSSTSLLTVLSSICPVDKTLIQDGTLTFNGPIAEDGGLPSENVINYRTTTWSDSDSVMIFKDLKTYYALITLIYHAHLSRYKEYRHRKLVPQNLTHCHIDDILALTTTGGRQSFGGSQRSECRESLQRIRKTNIELRPDATVDLSSLISASASGNAEGKTERTLRPLEELSRVEFVSGDGEWGESTMDYIVKLPEIMFEKLFTSDFHWLFPPLFLTVDELLFALYLYLRNHWTKGKTKKSFHVEDFYYQYEASTNNFPEFLIRLNTLLVKLAKSNGQPGIKKTYLSVVKQPYKRIFKIKLFGYHCQVDLESKTIDVELKEDQFYAALEMGPTTKRKSPTLSNKLSKLTFSELLKKKTLSSEEQEMLANLSKVGKDMLPKTNHSIQKRLPKIIACVNKGLGYIEVALGKNKDKPIFFTLMSDDEYVETICRNMAGLLGISYDDVALYIRQLLSTIPRSYQSRMIDSSDFQAVYEQYLRSKNTTDNTIENQVEFFKIAEDNPTTFHFMMSYVR